MLDAADKLANLARRQPPASGVSTVGEAETPFCGSKPPQSAGEAETPLCGSKPPLAPAGEAETPLCGSKPPPAQEHHAGRPPQAPTVPAPIASTTSTTTPTSLPRRLPPQLGERKVGPPLPGARGRAVRAPPAPTIEGYASLPEALMSLSPLPAAVAARGRVNDANDGRDVLAERSTLPGWMSIATPRPSLPRWPPPQIKRVQRLAPSTRRYPGGATYVGIIQLGFHHGFGTLTWKNGDAYEGEWHCNRRHGKGSSIAANGDTYEGEWQDDMRHGAGTYLYMPDKESHRCVYEGEWLRDKRHGQGTYSYLNDADVVVRYEKGEWQDDKLHGKGVNVHLNDAGEVDCYYEGDWHYDKHHGVGFCMSRDGVSYDGEWQNGTKHGRGVFKYSSGDMLAGEWHNGVEVGKYVYTSKNGDQHEGEWPFRRTDEGKSIYLSLSLKNNCSLPDVPHCFPAFGAPLFPRPPVAPASRSPGPWASGFV